MVAAGSDIQAASLAEGRLNHFIRGDPGDAHLALGNGGIIVTPSIFTAWPDDGDARADGGNFLRPVRADNRDEWRADGSGEVADSRIVGDYQTSPGKQDGELLEGQVGARGK